MITNLTLSSGIEDYPKSSLFDVPETARFGALHLIHGFGDFVLRFPFHKCCFPSLHGRRAVGQRFHCYVLIQLRASTEQVLGLDDIEHDDQKIQTSNGSVLRDFSS